MFAAFYFNARNNYFRFCVSNYAPRPLCNRWSLYTESVVHQPFIPPFIQSNLIQHNITTKLFTMWTTGRRRLEYANTLSIPATKHTSVVKRDMPYICVRKDPLSAYFSTLSSSTAGYGKEHLLIFSYQLVRVTPQSSKSFVYSSPFSQGSMTPHELQVRSILQLKTYMDKSRDRQN